MPFDLDSYLGMHAQALSLRAQRMTVLAENLANADTPHYKARDIDFRSALAQASGESGAAPGLVRTHALHLPAAGGGAGGVDTLYRIPHAPALDGNTVEADAEMAAVAQNALQYQATLTFLGGRLATLKSAITGQ